MTYRHTEDMGEISGFGGGYEKCCQDMLEAGVKWLDDNKDVKLRMLEMDSVFGIFQSGNDMTKQLENVIHDASYDKESGHREATGAMMHTVMQRLLMINKNGWDWYCEQMREHERENPDDRS